MKATIGNYLEKQRKSSAYRDVEFILQHILQKKRSELYLSWNQILTFHQEKKIQKFINLYKKGMPLDYILKKTEFFGRPFKIGKGVFIPRPETEILVEAVLKEKFKLKNKAFYFMDFGCGSGCIGLSLLLHFPRAYLFSIDHNKKALEMTKKNAKFFKISDRISIIHEDVLNLNPNDFPSIDLITANPPYLSTDDKNIEKSVLDFEPHSALFSGMPAITNWLNQSVAFLSKNYLGKKNLKTHSSKSYFFEIGYDQYHQTVDIIKNHPLIESFHIHRDLQGYRRIIQSQIKVCI